MPKPRRARAQRLSVPAALAFIVAIASCSPRQLALSGGPGDFVIAAVRGSEGFVTVESGPAGRALELPEDDGLYTYVLRSGQLVDPAGVILDEASLAELEVVIEAGEQPEGYGACERCVVPATHTPQILGAGDRCRVPAFAEGTDWDGGGLLEDTRGYLAIVQRGACPCPERDWKSPPRIDWQLIEPGPEGWPPDVVVSDDSGHIALFGEELAIRFAPNGERVETQDVAFRGPVRGAVALPSGAFVVASLRPTAHFEPFGVELHVFDSDFAARPIEIDPTFAEELRLIEPEGLIAVPGRRELTARGRSTSLLLCRPSLSESSWACPEIAPGFGESTEVVAVERLGDGALFSMTLGGRTTIYESVPSAEVDRVEVAEDGVSGRVVELDGSSIPFRSTNASFELGARRIGVAGQRIAACLDDRSTSLPYGAIVFTTTAAKSMALSGAPEWREAYRDPTVSCGPVSKLMGRIVFSFEADELVVSEDGSVDRRARSRPGIDRPATIFESGPGSRYAVTDDGSVYTSTGAEYGLLYGAPERLDDFRAIAALGDELWAIRLDGKAVRVSAELSVEELTLPGFQAGDEVIAAIGDERRRAILIAADRSGEPIVRRVSAEPPFEVSDLEAPRGTARVLDFAQPVPGLFVAIGEGQGLWVLDDREWLEVQVDWDDPATSEKEAAPAPRTGWCTSVRRPFDRRAEHLDTLYRGVGGSDGVGWAVGCGLTTLRVEPLARPPRAQRVSMFRPSAPFSDLGFANIGEIESALGLCGDRALLAAPGRGGVLSERGAIWELVPANGFNELREFVGTSATSHGLSASSGVPFGMVATERSAFVAFWGGAIRGSLTRAGESSVMRFPSRPQAVGATRRRVALGFVDGRLLVGSESP
ncbi:MAG: hypothetical protein HY791_32270 [Deltaproteobacteria bacterium]|nr:hypothetical protein [Deltaproteobacteria bacterium]